MASNDPKNIIESPLDSKITIAKSDDSPAVPLADTKNAEATKNDSPATTNNDNMHAIAKINPVKKPIEETIAGTPPPAMPIANVANNIPVVPQPQGMQGTQTPPPQGAQPQGMPPPPGAQPPPPAESMFAPMTDLSDQISAGDLSYVSEVDAALARKPSKGIVLLSFAVILFFIIMFIWAAFAAIDEVTKAEGQVISSQRTQSIQNLEGGILQEILVKEGQIVEKGTPLARLDNVMADSSYRDAFNKMLDHQVAIIRLEAELNDVEPIFPTNMASQMEGIAKKEIQGELAKKINQVISDHTATYNARMEQRLTEIKVLQEQFQQKKSEIDEQYARKVSFERSLKNAVAQRNLAYPLLQRRIYSRADFLKLEQSVISLQGDIEALAAAIPRTQAAASEAELRILFRQAELNASVTEEINKRRTEYNSLYETLSAGKDRVARTELRSPVYGTIKQIYINSIGGVVKPGESIMEVVPLDDSLLVEARIRPQDIAFLHAGQKAVVKISAYDYSVYGGLDGLLETISADTIEDKEGNFFYLVKVRTPKTSIEYRTEKLPIIPGMIATVDILTGKKTVLNYLLKPIIKAKQNALRER